MADEQSQEQGSIDDAIRQAERKLEQRIEELRSIAANDPSTGESGSSTVTTVDDADDLRGSTDYVAHEDVSSTPSTGASGGAGSSEDAVLRPVSSGASGGFVPDDDWEVPAWREEPRRSERSRPAASTGSDLGSTPRRSAARAPEPRRTSAASYEPAASASYSGEPEFGRSSASATPTPEETEFWAQTRTALRLLQQSADQLQHDLPQEVTRRVQEHVGRDLSSRLNQHISGQVEQIVRDEISPHAAALRQLQQELPVINENVERTLAEELEGPLTAIRQLHQELPLQFERVERSVERMLSEELTRTIHNDVAELEGSVGDTVARMNRSVHDGFEQMEQALRSQFDRLEHSMHGELEQISATVGDELEAPNATLRQMYEEVPLQFQRLDRTIREHSAADAVDHLNGAIVEQQRLLGDTHDALREQREQLRDMQTDTVEHIARELRTQLDSTRRGMREMVDRSMSGPLKDLAEAQKATLDRIGSITKDVEKDRLQRAEDVETMLDSMTLGWQTLLSAVERLLERTESVDARMLTIEDKLGAVDTLDDAVNATMTRVESQLSDHMEAISEHLSELQPAPVMVTVHHPDATIENATRPGFVRGTLKASDTDIADEGDSER